MVLGTAHSLLIATLALALPVQVPTLSRRALLRDNFRAIGTGLMVAGGIFVGGGMTTSVLGFRTTDRAMDYAPQGDKAAALFGAWFDTVFS